MEASIGEEITCILTGHDPDPHPDNDGIQPSWGSSLKTFTFEAEGLQSICGYVTDMHGAVSDEGCWVVKVQGGPEGPTSPPTIDDINGVGLGCFSVAPDVYSVSVRFQAGSVRFQPEEFDSDQDPLTYSWVVEFWIPSMLPGWWSHPTPSSGYGPIPSFETHFTVTNLPPETYKIFMPRILVSVTVHDNKGGSATLMREFWPFDFCPGLGPGSWYE